VKPYPRGLCQRAIAHPNRGGGKTTNGDVPEDDAVLRDLLQKRNHSILAHSLEPIGEKPARHFQEYVDAMVGEEKVRAGAEHANLREL
jgi:hypothetical protein